MKVSLAGKVTRQKEKEINWYKCICTFLKLLIYNILLYTMKSVFICKIQRDKNMRYECLRVWNTLGIKIQRED